MTDVEQDIKIDAFHSTSAATVGRGYLGAHWKEVTIHHSLMRAPLQAAPPPCRRTCQGLEWGRHTL